MVSAEIMDEGSLLVRLKMLLVKRIRVESNTRAFKKSVGLNGVGTKANNALSSYFTSYLEMEKKNLFL